MSDKLKSTFSISDPAMANAAKRRLERLAEQERIAAAERRMRERDRIGIVTIGRQLDGETSEMIKRMAARFHIDMLVIINMLASEQIIAQDAEVGCWRLASKARRAPQGPIIRKTWRST